MSDQLAGSVQYGPIDDTEVAAEPLASQGASTEASAEATIESTADQLQLILYADHERTDMRAQR